MLYSHFNCSILDFTDGSSLVRIKKLTLFGLFFFFKHSKLEAYHVVLIFYMYTFVFSSTSTLFEGPKVHTQRYVWMMVCGCCQEMDPFLSSPWGVHLWALATIVVVAHPLKISHVESARVCVRLTANGVVVRHQVLSPVDEDKGQTHVSWSVVGPHCLHLSW